MDWKVRWLEIPRGKKLAYGAFHQTVRIWNTEPRIHLISLSFTYKRLFLCGLQVLKFIYVFATGVVYIEFLMQIS